MGLFLVIARKERYDSGSWLILFNFIYSMQTILSPKSLIITVNYNLTNTLTWYSWTFKHSLDYLPDHRQKFHSVIQQAFSMQNQLNFSPSLIGFFLAQFLFLKGIGVVLVIPLIRFSTKSIFNLLSVVTLGKKSQMCIVMPVGLNFFSLLANDFTCQLILSLSIMLTFYIFSFWWFRRYYSPLQQAQSIELQSIIDWILSCWSFIFQRYWSCFGNTTDDKDFQMVRSDHC